MGSKQSQYDIGLDKNAANYVPLTPLSFLERSAAVYPNHVSTVYEGRSFTWAQTYSAAGASRPISPNKASAKATRSRPCCRTCRR